MTGVAGFSERLTTPQSFLPPTWTKAGQEGLEIGRGEEHRERISLSAGSRTALTVLTSDDMIAVFEGYDHE